MARVKRGVTAHKRHKRLLQDAEGRKGAKSRLIKPAREEHIHEELVQKIIHLRAKFLKTKLRDIKIALKQEGAQRTALLEQLRDYSNQLRDLDERE